MNVHLHGLLLDGVYRRGADGVLQFIEAGSPTDDEVHELLQIIIARLMKMLTRPGVLVQDMGQTCLPEPDADG